MLGFTKFISLRSTNTIPCHAQVGDKIQLASGAGHHLCLADSSALVRFEVVSHLKHVDEFIEEKSTHILSFV